MNWPSMPAWRRPGPWLRMRRLRALGIGAGAGLALLLVALAVYSAVALARFERVEERRATFVYAAAQPLVTGINVRSVDLAGTLARLKYRDSHDAPPVPGQFRRLAGAWEIHLRSAAGAPVRVEIHDDRITGVSRDGHDIGASALERSEERRVGKECRSRWS